MAAPAAEMAEEVDPGQQQQEAWWALDDVKPKGHGRKFDIGAYLGGKPPTDIAFTELVYASMRWGVDFKWSSEKEVKGYMGHIAYIAMKAMAGLYVSEAMSNYDNNIRKAAELQGTCVFMNYNSDFTLGSFRDTEHTQTDTEQEADCVEDFSTPFNIKSETADNASHTIESRMHMGVSAPVLDNDIVNHDADAPDLSDIEDEAESEEADAAESTHTCSQCGNVFGDAAALKAHAVIHTGNKTYEVLRRHLMGNNGGGHQSTVVNDALLEPKPSDIITRGRYAGEKRHACSVCGKKCPTPSLLKIHMIVHTRERPHICLKCGKQFSQKYRLRKHMAIHTEDTTPKCYVCSGEFLEPDSLKTHMKTHPRSQPKEKQYHCSVCKKGFAHSHSLKTHMRFHTGEWPHKCSQCQKGFISAVHLKIHMKSHLRKKKREKTYKCRHCDEKFTEPSALSTHKVAVHTARKGVLCPECGKLFIHPSKLKLHMLTHTGERPHKCPLCDKLLRRPSTLKAHMMIHTGEKPHQCEQCGKRFSQSDYLTSHMKTHTGEKPHVCSVCSKTFSLSWQVKEHMRTHTGEKPYQCSECGKQFSRSSTLKRHMMTHTGEKPHTCPVCHNKFREAGNLKQHMRTHNGEKAHKRAQSDKQCSQTT